MGRCDSWKGVCGLGGRLGLVGLGLNKVVRLVLDLLLKIDVSIGHFDL
jgi:hypothetical protein